MERKPTKNEALEALDFIINVLKEHEKDLDRLISQLAIITESLGETGEIAEKIENVENRITALQDEITNLLKHVSSPREAPSYRPRSAMVVKCKNWEDFKVMAAGAESVSYVIKEDGKSFQADALIKDRIISCIGEFPSNSSLLKLWLSKELNISENTIFEGVMDLG